MEVNWEIKVEQNRSLKLCGNKAIIKKQKKPTVYPPLGKDFCTSSLMQALMIIKRMIEI